MDSFPRPKDQFLLVKVDFLTAQCQHLAVHQYIILTPAALSITLKQSVSMIGC